MWPDPNDAWQRFQVLSANHPVGYRPGGRAGQLVALGAVILAASVTPGLLKQPASSDPIARMYDLSAQSGHTPKAPRRSDHEFARMLARLEASGELRRISDVCCEDRDGEGPADDGVLTVWLTGSRSTVVIMYEDTQRSGRFQAGDVILMVSRPGLSAEAPDPRLLGS